MAEAGQDAGSVQRRAATGAVWTLTHTVVSLPIAFLVNILLARILGVVDYGRLAVLTMTIGIVGVIVVSGVDSAMVQFGSKAHARGDFPEVRRLLSQVQGFRLMFLAPISSAAVLLFVDVPIALLLLALFFGVWVPAGLSGAKVSLTLEQRTDVDAKIQMLGNVASQTAIVATLLLISTADAVWATRVACAGLILLAVLPFVDSRYRGALLRPGNPFRLGRPFLTFSAQTGVAAIIATLVLSRSEVFLLQVLSDPRQIGLFAMAFGLAGHILAPAQALLNPIRPAVAALAETDAGAIASAFRRLVRVLSTLTALIVAAGAPTIAILVPSIYGAEYSEASSLIMLLVPSSAILLVTFPLQAFVLARLRAGSILHMNIVALAVALVVAVPGIAVLGALGAVVSKLAIALTRMFYLLVMERSSFATPVRVALRDMLPLGFGIACSWVAWLIARHVSDNILGSMLGGAMGALLYILVINVSRSGITEGDARATIGALPRSIRRPASVGVDLLARRVEG